MDWYSWLSKSSLDTALVYEYYLLFSQNELEEEDIPHFNHEFLQSMGISIAKHRLEILKLAKKEKNKSPPPPPPMARLLDMIHRTKNCLARYVYTLAHRDSSAIVVVPRRSYDGGGRRKGRSMLKRSNRRPAVEVQSRAMITDGRGDAGVAAQRSYVLRTAGLIVCHQEKKDKGKEKDKEEEEEEEEEEIRWDSMFQGLKPT